MKPVPQSFAVASVVPHNRWPEAAQLADSLAQHHPGTPLFLLALEALPSEVKPPANASLIFSSALALSDFTSSAMQYSSAELCARMKPALLLHLFPKFETLVLLAPETLVCSPLDFIFQQVADASVLLTPRYVRPFPKADPFPEIEALQTGHFHDALLVVRRTPTSLRLLRWMEDRCRTLAFDEPAQNLCRDRKWLNLVPCLFPEVRIERSPALLIDPFNLHERALTRDRNGRWIVDGALPLLLFHRASANHYAPVPPEFALPERRVKEAPSRLNEFECGAPISAAARRIYSAWSHRVPSENPFAEGSRFEEFCRRQGLLGSMNPPLRPEQLPVGHRVAAVIRWGLRATAFLLGPHRYEMLVRYLRHICSMRNQHGLFFDGDPEARSGLDPMVSSQLRNAVTTE